MIDNELWMSWTLLKFSFMFLFLSPPALCRGVLCDSSPPLFQEAPFLWNGHTHCKVPETGQRQELLKMVNFSTGFVSEHKVNTCYQSCCVVTTVSVPEPLWSSTTNCFIFPPASFFPLRLHTSLDTILEFLILIQCLEKYTSLIGSLSLTLRQKLCVFKYFHLYSNFREEQHETALMMNLMS